MNPEQSLAAAISSCHMMTFLALAAKFKWPVKNYKDKAIAHLGKNLDGKDYDHKTGRFTSIKANRGNRGHGTKNE